MKIVKWFLITIVLYLVLLWAIGRSGEGGAYLLYYLYLPVYKFSNFDGALRVYWGSALIPIVVFIFYFLVTLCIIYSFQKKKKTTLLITYFSLFALLIMANVVPSIAGIIYRKWTISKISKMTFSNINNSEICNNDIVYTSRVPGGSEIWSMDEHGQNKINLSKKNPVPDKIPLDMSPKWSPDGKMILFSAERNGVHGVYIMSCDGSIQYVVANTANNNNYPEWSPDGKLIVYSDFESLRIVDYTGKNDRSIISKQTFGPSFSLNGKQIAYCTKSGDYVCNIELINLDGTERRTLIADGNYNFNPEWIDNEMLSYSTDLGQYKTNFFKFNKNPIYQTRCFSISRGRNIEQLPITETVQTKHIGVFSKNNQIFIGKVNVKQLRQLTFEGDNYSPDIKKMNGDN